MMKKDFDLQIFKVRRVIDRIENAIEEMIKDTENRL